MQQASGQQDLSDKTKEGIIWSTFLPALFQIFRFAISVVTARLLDPKDFGIMGIASITIFYANSLTNFGFSTALIQRKEISEDHINSVFSLNLLISIFLVVLTCLLAKPLATFFKIKELDDVLQMLSSIFLITAFYTIPITLLRRDVSYKAISMVEFTRGTVQSFVAVGLAWAGFSYWSLASGLVVSNAIATLMIMRKVTWRPRFLIKKKATQEIFNFASWNFISSQVRLLGDYADKLIVGKFLGDVQLGYYEKAFSVAYMPVESVAMKISGVMFSSFSRNQDNPGQLCLHLYKALATISIICFPVFVGGISLGKDLVSVLFGTKWEPMTMTLEIMLAAFLLNSLTNVVNSMNLGCGNYRKQIKIRMICVCFLLALCLLSACYSIELVAISLLVYHAVFFSASLLIAKKSFPITWKMLFYYLRPALLGSSIMVLVVKIIQNLVAVDNGIVQLVFLSTVGASVYVLVIMLCKFEEIQFIKNDVSLRLKKFGRLRGR